MWFKGEVKQAREIEGISRAPSTSLHRSPGLEAALSHLHEGRFCRVLDLGPAVAQNVEFFSRFPCRLRIIDLLGQLVAEPASASRLENEPMSLFAEFLSIDEQPFDLVLAWTVFDHIPIDAAHDLVTRLAQLTQPGGRLFAINSTRKEAAATGFSFGICERTTLEYHPVVLPEYRAAPFNPAAFSELLTGFTIDHSVVLRHGFQEYVAVRGDSLVS